MGRFYRGYEWRMVITDLNSAPVTALERLAAARTISYMLNKPATTAAKVPSDDPRVNIEVIEPGMDAPMVSFCDRLGFLLRREDTTTPWVSRWSGLVEQIEDQAGAEQPYSTFTGYDPWQYLFARPVMNGTSLIGPDGISWDDTRGDVIARQIMEATIGLHGPCYIALADDWDETDQLDINFQQGTSVGAALQQLCATGTMDVVMDPVYDPLGSPGICCVMHVYTQAGTTRDEAVFSWDVGRSVQGISSLLDGDLMANTVQFFNGQGGPAVTPATDPTSESRYGHWEVQQFFPGQTLPVAVEAMAQFQLSLRKQGKRTVRLTPQSLLSPTPLLDYGLGDRIPVHATSRLRQAIPWTSDPSAYTRVYGIPITLSDDGVEQVSGLVCSADGF